MMETRPKEWLEGRQAFMDGIEEKKCPYDIDRDLRRWSNWICGYCQAANDKFEEELALTV